MTTYRDFEDLRDNCPAEIRADIAIDLEHDERERLDAVWPTTADGGFRLSLTQRVSEFWEAAVRGAGDVPDDHFAIAIPMDSYADPEMGYTLLLDLHAFCGSEAVGELCWDVLDTADQETRFCREMPAVVLSLLGEYTDTAGLRCTVEVTEVAEV